MLGKLPAAMLAVAGLSLAPAAMAKTETASKTAPDPNEKVCEKIKPVGSRVATKRVCATRAEWEEYRRQDRDAVEKAQRLGCLTQDNCGGT
jgi:hypothetical protein